MSHPELLLTTRQSGGVRPVSLQWRRPSSPLSDIELVAEYEPVEVRWPETVAFTFDRYVDAYNMLFRILLYFYERDIEWLLEEIAKPETYGRDLTSLVRDSPLNYLRAIRGRGGRSRRARRRA